MIPIKEVFEDVVLDNVNSSENGDLGMLMYNRLSRRAENRLHDYLTGDIENIKPPTPYTDQKLRDILSPFITKYSVNVNNGVINRPEDYYTFDNLVMLGNYDKKITNSDDEDEEAENTEGCNTVIELLESSQFDMRCKTFVEGLQPSFTKPIARLVGRTIEFMPKDIGSVILQYIRYPVYGKIVPKIDEQFNDQVIDETASTNYEHDEFARELLVFFITDTFAIHTREKALKEQNMVTQKLVRG